MKLLLLLTLALTVQAREVTVKISSDDPKAAATLLEGLNKKGKAHGLTFRGESHAAPQYRMVVQWRHGGPGYQHPTAEVLVFSSEKELMYTVSRRGFKLTRSSALIRCAEFIVRDLARTRPSPVGAP
jgi:hypothetical protein